MNVQFQQTLLIIIFKHHHRILKSILNLQLSVDDKKTGGHSIWTNWRSEGRPVNSSLTDNNYAWSLQIAFYSETGNKKKTFTMPEGLFKTCSSFTCCNASAKYVLSEILSQGFPFKPSKCSLTSNRIYFNYKITFFFKRYTIRILISQSCQ